MFSRIVEPELMLTSEQVDAYASIDFTESHGRLISQITECFPGFDFNGTVLNLGCGTGDDSFRFLNQFPLSRILGIDGSAPMIARAKHDLALRHSHLSDRISFVEAYIPSHEIPLQPYVGIVSNSLLHHMHAPDALWSTVRTHAKSGTAIFIADLRRPGEIADAAAIVDRYAPDAPQAFRIDFYNSLCAALTVEEVRLQLIKADLHELTVSEIGDRHMITFGIRR